MIFRQKENHQRHLWRLGLMFCVVFIILISLLLSLRNQSIQNHLSEMMVQTKTRIELSATMTDIQREVQALPTEAKYILLQVEEGAAQYSEGDRNLLPLYHQIAENDKTANQLALTGVTFDGYWGRISYSEDEQQMILLYWFPKSYYGVTSQRFYLSMILLASILLFLVYGIYYSAMQMIAKPIMAMNEALSSLENPEIESRRFEYIGGRFKELDALGETVTYVENKLYQRYAELMNSERRLTVLLDHLNLGVLLIDSEGNVELFNPEATEIFGLTDISFGRSYEEVIRSTHLVDMIDTVVDSQVALTEELELYLPRSLFVDVNIIPYQETEEEKGAVLVLLYDISQIQRLESIRSEFVANASHELRTPVTSIKGFAETLNDGALEDRAIAKEFVQIILNESNRLENIINDILELSRVEKQKDTATEEMVNIAEVVKTIMTSLKKKAKTKNIQLIAHIEQPSPLLIHGNQHRVEQILTNLVDNAINYSDPNSQVRIRAYAVSTGIKIEVIDNGVGIPEDEQERIFERFYRVDKGRSRNSGGTGLGLSIVRNLVRIFGGEIKVQSKPGEGSTFTVYLPYRIY